ncbi:MAG: hypothetical protein RIQ46_806 [Pseudomonadota bacterium]
MNHSLNALAMGLACLSLPAAAHAEADPPENRTADTSFSVGEIIVTARGMAGSTDNVLTSVDRLGGDIARRADVRNAW